MINDFIRKLLGIKKEIKIHLDEDSVRENNMRTAMANQIAELKAELAKHRQKEFEKRESDKDKKEDNEVRWELNKQKKQIEKKEYPQYLSLKTFFRRYLTNKQFKDKLGFYSYDRGKKLADFGDIGFASDGSIVLVDEKNEVIIKSEELKKIFFSLGGLGNDIIDGKIPVCFDSEGTYIPNMYVEESYEVTPDFDGRLKYTKVRKKEVYKVLEDYRSRINDLQQYLSELELMNNKLKQENDQYKISQRVGEDMLETSRRDLSMVEKDATAIRRVFGSSEREIASLRNIHIIEEDKIDKLERELQVMMDEAEGEKTKSQFQKAIERVQTIRRELVKDEPMKEIRVIEKTEKAIN